MNDKWKLRYLRLARHWARECSKDPSTQVGAVIVDDKRVVVGLGYNGFPRGVPDYPERYADRELKYPRVVHAEPNAILNSTSLKSLVGATMFVWPFFTCNECAKLIIQAGIRHIVAPDSDKALARWGAAHTTAKEMYDEVGLTYEFLVMGDD